MSKGSFVTYVAHGHTITAIVRIVHRDGTLNVEARHVLINGKLRGCYLGYRYRVASGNVQEAQS